MDYQKHIEELAAQAGVRVNYMPGLELAHSYSEPDKPTGSSFLDADLRLKFTGQGQIVIPPWDEVEEKGKLYWVALHELGHLAKRHAGPDYLLLIERNPAWAVTDQEAEAWMWAVEHGGEITPEAEWAIDFGMSTYAPKFGAGPLTKALEDLVGAEVERSA